MKSLQVLVKSCKSEVLVLVLVFVSQVLVLVLACSVLVNITVQNGKHYGTEYVRLNCAAFEHYYSVVD